VLAFKNMRSGAETHKTISKAFKVIAGGKTDTMSKARAADLSLVRNIAAGDQAAMKQLYELHSGPLFHFLYR